MSQEKYTDLPRNERSDIAVIQPGSTFGLRRRSFLNDPDWIQNAFYDVYDFHNIRHVGTLTCNPYGRHTVVPKDFKQCGGKINVSDDLKAVHQLEGVISSFSQRDFSLHCDNPSCDLLLITTQYVRYQQFRNMLLHLMLKQVVPEAEFCNFIDCSRAPRFPDASPEILKTTQSLGFLAVTKCLWGVLNNHSNTLHHAESHILAFMLTQGMDIREEGCGAWSSWLQYLVCQKFIKDKELYKSLSEDFLGPKPVR
jgi:hypothetical protein